MRSCHEISKSFLLRIISFFLLLSFLLPSSYSFTQETNSRVSGIVRTGKNEILSSATVIVIHEPTKNTYSTQTNKKGYFYFFDIKPGGPYTITISHIGFESLTVKDLFLSYSTPNFYSNQINDELSEFILKEKSSLLTEVIVQTDKQAVQKFGTETNIDNKTIHLLPSISRNIQDYVRLIPQAKVNGDGMMSLAGQSNKFNAFFIDGANSNDLLGLSASGVAGGQTNTPPISIEAIEAIKVSLSPYDGQYSNFTGASINAITRSGSNQFKTSAWYYFRGEKMAGRSPVPIEKPGSPGVFERPLLTDFFNQTKGVWASGALVQNKLFYFLLAESQNELQPQPFNFSEYRGNTNRTEQINALADTIRRRFSYEPGEFLEIVNELKAKRFILKIDWNPDLKNKLTLSYRYNNAERLAAASQNGPSILRFSNNRLGLQSRINSASLEWKRYFKGSANNRLLVTYNNDLTDRKIVGQPFPFVIITDGNANIGFGSPGSAHLNLFKANEFNILNISRFFKNNHAISAGMDINFSKYNDVIVSNYFGQYMFSSVSDFINNNFPSRYLRNVSLVDKPVNDDTKAGAKFNSLRLSAFVNDEIQANENLKLNFSARIDGNSLPVKPQTDIFFNTIAKPEIEKYYDLEGAISGQAMKTHWQLSPRFGFQYKIPAEKLTVRGGAGVFTGHILSLWASEVYFANIYNITVTNPQAYGFRFNPNPYEQPDYQTFGIDPEKVKGNKVLIARKFKYPTSFRTTLGIDKKIKDNWLLTTEIMFTKNIHEHRYININILPPTKMTPLPDRRNIYSLNTNPDKIPMAGGNPYNSIYLLTNNSDKKGFAYNFTLSINRSFRNDLFVSAAYSYGNSFSFIEPGNVNNSDQWNNETINGKNFAGRGISDYDPGHRFIVSAAKKINYGKWSTLVTLFYNGQSGSAFSYVYDGSMINDNGRSSHNDLIYIPTKADLSTMNFIPIGTTYSAQQQKEALDHYIENDKYLRKHRGQFAERNGARSPFTHVIDLRLQQELKIKTRKKEIQVSIVYDVFNFTNMLNNKWGRTYFISGDSWRLIRFVGFIDPATLTPQYQFTPFNGKPWSVQSSTAPGSSARWISQLGVKISMN